jgi:hypothetical protein
MARRSLLHLPCKTHLPSPAFTSASTKAFPRPIERFGNSWEVADFYDQALEKGQVLVAVEEGDGVTHEHVSAADRIFASTGSEFVTLRKS